MTALVADDDPGTRLLLRRVLEQDMACTVFEATDGNGALDRLRQTPVDFALLDLQMPGLTGIEALQVIRASAELAALPVVVMTADRSEDVVRRVLALGIADYLVKPLDRSAVRGRLGRVIDRLVSTPAAPPAA
jgi:two-component system, chemotaxis family, chemotaxis protein CheY